jgi:hypothetical protein
MKKTKQSRAEFRAKAQDIMEKHDLELSRMIAYSKSTYLSKRPNNKAIFNANVVTSQGKIWWGDLDLTDDSEKLQHVSDELGCNLYVLHEMHYRFGKESRPFHEVEKLAVKKFSPKSKQTPKTIVQCLQSLVSKVAQFFSVTRK